MWEPQEGYFDASVFRLVLNMNGADIWFNAWVTRSQQASMHPSQRGRSSPKNMLTTGRMYVIGSLPWSYIKMTGAVIRLSAGNSSAVDRFLSQIGQCLSLSHYCIVWRRKACVLPRTQFPNIKSLSVFGWMSRFIRICLLCMSLDHLMALPHGKYIPCNLWKISGLKAICCKTVADERWMADLGSTK